MASFTALAYVMFRFAVFEIYLHRKGYNPDICTVDTLIGNCSRVRSS